MTGIADPNTPEPSTELMDAVNAAIASTEPAAPADPPVDNGGDNPPADPANPPAAPADPAAPPAGDNPDPNAPPADPNAPPAADPNKPTDPPAPAAKPSDEFGELPADVPAKTRERFDTLKSKYDEVATERDTLRADADEARGHTQKWVDMVETTGASPQQFGEMMALLSHFNSGDPARLRVAFDTMQREVAVLGKALGLEVGGAHDPLDDPANADLKQQLEDGIPRAVLLELAQTRATARLQEQQRQAHVQRTAAQQAEDNAVAAVKAFADAQKAIDPAAFNAKYATLRDNGTIDLIYKLPPDQWAGAMQQAFAKVRIAAPAPDPRTHQPAAPSGVRQTGNPNSGAPVTSEPASAMEAVQRALGIKPA